MAKSKLKEALEKYMSGTSGIRVGILENATYPDGLHVAQVAYWQEFGASVEVEAKKGVIHRKVDKHGNLINGGRFVKASKANLVTEHDIPAHTINIPPRPFFRNTISEGKKTWPQVLSDAIADSGDEKKALSILGEVIKDELSNAVLSWETPHNALSTWAKKGFNKPLIDTGQMAKSFSYEVTDD
ncbi:TPA: hypothetical protein ACRRWY_003709 [Morganella morganii]